MAAAESLSRIVHHLRRRCGVGPTDGDLLVRFTAQRDEAAFAELVERHGRLVFGVARRHLPDRQSAEDVVQATFAALAQHAKRLGRPASLVNWLYTVALRQSRLARIRFARQRAVISRIPSPTQPPDPLHDVTGRELVTIIDDELARLPERYRLPLILCAIEGLSRDEAAARLGWTLGSFRGRLERGRELLRKRLTKRGLTVPAVFAGGLLATPAEALPLALVQAVVRAAMALPPAAMPLKLAVASAVVLTVLGAGTGIALLPGGQPTPKANPPAPAVAAEAEQRLDRFGDPLPPGVIARLGTIRLRQVSQNGGGFVAQFSPDSRSVLIWNENTLRLWDAATGKLRWQFKTEWNVERAAFAPDGRTIAAISGAGLILVDAAAGKQLRILAPNFRRWTGLAFSPDSRMLAAPPNPDQPTSGPATVADPLALWDTSTGKVVGTLPTDGMVVHQLAFSADGRTLIGYGAASTQSQRRLRITAWDVASRTVRKTTEFDTHYNGRLSDDGRYIAAQGKPFTPHAGEVRLWETATGTDLGPLPEHGGRVQRFSGKTLGVLHFGKSNDPNELVVWDVASQKESRRFHLPQRAEETEFAPDGRTFLSTIRGQVVMLWDVATGKRLLDFAGHDGRLTSLRFTPDGQSVVTAGAGSVRVWDAATGEQRQSLSLPDGCYFSEPVLSPDGREVLVNEMAAGASSRLLRFDFPGGALRPPLTIPTPSDSQPADKIIALNPRYRPDGRSAVATLQISYTTGPGLSHPPVRTPWHVWDLATGRPTASRSLADNEFVVGFAPGGSRLLTYAAESADKPGTSVDAGTDRIPPEPVAMILSFHDTVTGRRLIRIRQPDNWLYLYAFSHDVQTMVTFTFRSPKAGVYSLADTVTVRGWELRTGRERFHIDMKTAALNFDSTAVAFSPDDRILCIARRNGRLQFFDTTTGTELPGRSGIDPAITHLAFRSDGQRLSTGLEDGTTLIWDIADIRPHDGKHGPVDAATLEHCWLSLADDDAGKAHSAVWMLIGASPQAVDLFVARLRPAAATPEDRLKRLVADLDSPQFRVRQAAERDLVREGDQAESVLRVALRENPTAEQRQRIEAVLAAPPAIPSGDALRALRAIEVLEHIATPSAKDGLTALAAGAPAATLTGAAAEALKRLDSH